MRIYIWYYLKGIAMGAADVVPGVSGGTIALITGVYERLITAIAGINRVLWRRYKAEGFQSAWRAAQGDFLLSLFLGIVTSIVSLARVFQWFLEYYPILLWSFFFGLILASIIYLIGQVHRWSMIAIVLGLLSSVVSYEISLMSAGSPTDSYWYIFFSGFIAIIAMILPGISGAFILLLLGSYQTVLDILTDLLSGIDLADNLLKIGLLAIGALIGLKSFAGLLRWLFTRYKDLTLTVLIGFMIGSLNKVWPWKETITSEIIHGKLVILNERSVLPNQLEEPSRIGAAVVCALVGFILVLLLERLAPKA